MLMIFLGRDGRKERLLRLEFFFLLMSELFLAFVVIGIK